MRSWNIHSRCHSRCRSRCRCRNGHSRMDRRFQVLHTSGQPVRCSQPLVLHIRPVRHNFHWMRLLLQGHHLVSFDNPFANTNSSRCTRSFEPNSVAAGRRTWRCLRTGRHIRRRQSPSLRTSCSYSPSLKVVCRVVCDLCSRPPPQLPAQPYSGRRRFVAARPTHHCRGSCCRVANHDRARLVTDTPKLLSARNERQIHWKVLSRNLENSRFHWTCKTVRSA